MTFDSLTYFFLIWKELRVFYNIYIIKRSIPPTTTTSMLSARRPLRIIEPAQVVETVYNLKKDTTVQNGRKHLECGWEERKKYHYVSMWLGCCFFDTSNTLVILWQHVIVLCHILLGWGHQTWLYWKKLILLQSCSQESWNTQSTHIFIGYAHL